MSKGQLIVLSRNLPARIDVGMLMVTVWPVFGSRIVIGYAPPWASSTLPDGCAVAVIPNT
jgi:hypothetical protein